MLLRFLGNEGRLAQWPAKRSNQLLVLKYLANKFTNGQPYTERQVNDVLQQWHTYGDWATLRRALIDEGLLTRKHDGTEYRRVFSQN